jgi:formylglycine-generating enzyme required for sulfatase activity
VKNRRLKRVSPIGTCILVAVVISIATAVHAAETQALKESFRHLYEQFGQQAVGKVKIISGPKAVKMRRDSAPGKQWTATSGLYKFKLTIENKAECKIEKLVGILEKLPASYMSVCAAVSGDAKDGVAVYADLGGAPASGGLGYVDIVPTAGALAVVRATGPALLDTVGAKDETILKQWTQAIKSEGSVSARGDASCKDDIAEYAALYAVCLNARYSHHCGHLQRISRKRGVLWAQMLSLPTPVTGKTPPAAKVSEAQVAEARKLGIPVSFTNSIGMTFVLVPSGTFTMGSQKSAEEVRRLCNMPQAQVGWFTDEHPRSKVTLTAFYMSVHEVSHGQYATAAKPNSDPRHINWEILRCPVDLLAPDKPAVFVSRNDAEAFFKVLTQRETKAGRRYSLPTETQWEYACRAGSTTPFSFGETLSTDQANYDGGSTYGDGVKGKARGTTMPVGKLPANEWSLHDMHGNAAEWCSDWYADYTGKARTDPIGPAQPLRRDHVIRGGSWRSYPGACRSACRLKGSYYNFRKSYVGFRAVCALPAASGKKK